MVIKRPQGQGADMQTLTSKELKALQRKETIKELKKLIKKNNTVYTILRHVSRSGMLRHISVIVIRKNKPYCIDHLVARLLDYKYAKPEGLKVGGCGMDMGYHIVYNLTSALYKDGYAVKHEWL